MSDNPESKSVRTFVRGRNIIEGGILFGFFDEVSPCLDERGIPDLPELLRKAREGELAALFVFACYTRWLCKELELLAQEKPDFVKQIACTFNDWPIVYSLHGAGKNPTATKYRKLLSNLDVGGDHAFRPAYQRQRHRPDNFWSRYAINVVECLRMNQVRMLELAEVREPKPTFLLEEPVLMSTHRSKWFDVGDKIIRIAEWQEKCHALPTKLTKANFKQFMDLSKFAIREFWLNSGAAHYIKVKESLERQIHFGTDGEYLDLAFRKIGRAMRGLAHK